MHRICAALLGLTTLWHIGRVVFTRDGHEDFLALMPEAGDGGRWLAALKAKLAGKPIDVEWGRYTLGQKAQYWAVGCGTILMLASGVILLFGHTAVAALPKWLVDTIRVTHGGQGVELMVFIILWHIYSTHFAPHRFPMDHSWLTGKISKEQLKVYHRREYRRIFGEDPK
jgi:cytochrome b subunit of formate dehydrogenase